MYYGNVSWAILKAKVQHTHIWIIVFFQSILAVVDISTAESFTQILNTLAYIMATFLFISLDSMEIKKRSFCFTIGILFTCLNIFNILGEMLWRNTNKIILIDFSTHVINKSMMRRMVYMNTFFMTLKGLFILLFDPKQAKLMFLSKSVFKSEKFNINVNK